MMARACTEPPWGWGSSVPERAAAWPACIRCMATCSKHFGIEGASLCSSCVADILQRTIRACLRPSPRLVQNLERDAEILRLRAIGPEYTFDAIAAELGVTKGVVAGVLYRERVVRGGATA